MTKIISVRAAAHILITALAGLLLFHVLILFKVVPADIVWGGQVGDSPYQLVIMEIIAIMITLLFILVVRLRLRDLQANRPGAAGRIGIWIVAAYFALNTVGNLASGVAVENLIFAPLTIVLALLAVRLGLSK